MFRCIRYVAVAAIVVIVAQQSLAQESKAAKVTRERLKQVIDLDEKEVGIKAFFEDVVREMDKGIKFKIDNASGISNNSKISYKAKKVTVEQIFNEVSEKNDFGWYVVSNPDNNKVDGWVIFRKNSKGKERGYELGKEPKK